MKVTVKDYTVQVTNDIAQKASIFLRLAAEDIVRNSTPNTPMKTGALRQGVLKETLGLKGKVAWQKDYAAKMEEMQFKNYTTPGTGKDYAKNAVHETIAGTKSILSSSGLI